MRIVRTSRWHGALLLLLPLVVGQSHADPVGFDNFDFARLGRLVSWSQAGNFGGWSRTSADVNGDHRLDLLLYAQDAESWRTWVALSSGDGTFGIGVSWSAAGTWLDETVLATDLNGDERADLISLSFGADLLRISAALSNGSGVFGVPMATEIASNYVGWTPALGDVNGDSRKDLILQSVDENAWRVHIALNRGDGSFAGPVAWTAHGDFLDVNMGLGDFDGDGRTDVAIDSSGIAGWRSWVALARGDGHFSAPIEWTAPTGWTTGRKLVTWTPRRGDFNGDGRTDLQLSTYDKAGWRSHIAMSDGRGSFAQPMLWTSEEFGASWTFSQDDFNGDGAMDMVAQRADANGWQARVAISLGDGTFIKPKPWAELEANFDGWQVTAIDVSGDGRADVIAHFADSAGWRTSAALAQPCDTVLGSQDDFAGRIGALPNPNGGQIVCFRPGIYKGEIAVVGKRSLTLVAPHGDVSIESTSVMSGWDSRDPGATIQVLESEHIELDGLTIRNWFTYRPPSGDDQTFTVSRAIEVIRSQSIKLSHSRLISAGKQTVHAREVESLTLADALVECYYFCVDARWSSVHAWSSYFRANHVQIPTDNHAIFWSHESDQRYTNSTMEFITGKAVFAGVNDFNRNVLEVTGETIVSAHAEGWVAQHANYDGLNVRLYGAYTDLAEWYFVRDAGWQNNAQVCHQPVVGWAHCVGRFNGVSTPSLDKTSPIGRLLECRKSQSGLQATLAQLGIGLKR